MSPPSGSSPIACSSAAARRSIQFTADGASWTRGHLATRGGRNERPQKFWETYVNLVTDELIQADDAFAGNRLLSTFPPEARALIEPYGTIVQLKGGETALTRGE